MIRFDMVTGVVEEGDEKPKPQTSASRQPLPAMEFQPQLQLAVQPQVQRVVNPLPLHLAEVSAMEQMVDDDVGPLLH